MLRFIQSYAFHDQQLFFQAKFLFIGIRTSSNENKIRQRKIIMKKWSSEGKESKTKEKK